MPIKREDIQLTCAVVGAVCAIIGAYTSTMLMLRMHKDVKGIQATIHRASAVMARAQQFKMDPKELARYEVSGGE
jgi:hypothetical protein